MILKADTESQEHLTEQVFDFGRCRKNGYSACNCWQVCGMVSIFRMPSHPTTETDQLIAGHIRPFIPNDATVQLGIGGMSNAPSEMMAQSDLKDLGMHIEFCCGAYYALYQAGKLTNAKKQQSGQRFFWTCTWLAGVV